MNVLFVLFYNNKVCELRLLNTYRPVQPNSEFLYSEMVLKYSTIDLCREGAVSAPDTRYSGRDETCLCFVLSWITTVRGRN